MTFDLVLKGGRVIDPASGLDQVADVAFSNGLIAEVNSDLNGRKIRDVSGKVVTPGLIDLHTHVYWGGTSLSVDADKYARRCAATTLVDAGSAGPGNFHGFQSHVIERSKVRILAYLHISYAGIYAFSPTIMVGESQDMRLMATAETGEVAKANAAHIIGIKVRVGKHTSGRNGIEPLKLALEVAEANQLPLMAHIDEPDPDYEDVVDLLRSGDVLTHCFRPDPNGPVLADGRMKGAILEARKRGVLFDVGHGMGAFSWNSAQAALGQDFPPDTISSDVHILCENGPAWDLLRTMNKLHALGMSLSDVIRASTLAPADAIGRHDLGRLVPGAAGDASIIDVRDETIDLTDVTGVTRTAPVRFEAVGRVMAGKYEDAA